VIDTEVEGHSQRVYKYKYVLADGRTNQMNEGESQKRAFAQTERDGPEKAQLRPGSPRGLTQAELLELRHLSEAGGGELVRSYQEQVRGRMLTFEQKRYVLRDGAVVLQSRGKPSGH
jgi:hypothetical protein